MGASPRLRASSTAGPPLIARGGDAARGDRRRRPDEGARRRPLGVPRNSGARRSSCRGHEGKAVTPALPLADVKVVDASGEIGAYCAKTLADLGASVTVVEEA